LRDATERRGARVALLFLSSPVFEHGTLPVAEGVRIASGGEATQHSLIFVLRHIEARSLARQASLLSLWFQ
jgi:hypothetical protein